MLKFKSVITVKLLQYYLLNPTAKHHINELARLLAVDAGNLYRKLKELENEGLFLSEKQGNLRYFYLNKKYPLYKEIEKVFTIEHGLPVAISDNLDRIKGIKEAYIFGSYAKGKLKNDSDIDVLLIGKHSALAAKRIILPLSKTFGREINVIDLTEDELNAKRQNHDEFIAHIFKQPYLKII
ncbi:MAG: nucleotidyltransferase domain-containing protein [bacterium]